MRTRIEVRLVGLAMLLQRGFISIPSRIDARIILGVMKQECSLYTSDLVDVGLRPIKRYRCSELWNRRGGGIRNAAAVTEPDDANFAHVDLGKQVFDAGEKVVPEFDRVERTLHLASLIVFTGVAP